MYEIFVVSVRLPIVQAQSEKMRQNILHKVCVDETQAFRGTSLTNNFWLEDNTIPVH